MSEAQHAINVYTCPCGWKAVTKNLVEGTTPFMIPCERCDGDCYSAFYRVPQERTPTHEWFKPATDEELIAVVDRELATLGQVIRKQRSIIIDETREHVAMGGLLLRPVRAQVSK